MNARVFVDTNILLYARDQKELEKRPIAQDWMHRLWNERRGCVSVQVLNEFFVNATRKLKPGLTTAEAWDDIEALQSWNPLGMDMPLLARAYAVQTRYGLSWWDSLIVAAAEAESCETILSEDLDDTAHYFGITVINPFR